jgi:hypothetical protein
MCASRVGKNGLRESGLQPPEKIFSMLISMNKIQEIADGSVPLDGVPEPESSVDAVFVPSSLPGDADGPGVLEIADYALDRPFGDTNAKGNFPENNIRVRGKTQENVAVVGEEGPRGFRDGRLFFLFTRV